MNTEGVVDLQSRRERTRELNDAFRKSFQGGTIFITTGFAALHPNVRRTILEMIQTFDAFDDEDEPWGTHNFISVERDGQTFFAKIDYFNLTMNARSPDAADPTKTHRVLTVMLAEEY